MKRERDAPMEVGTTFLELNPANPRGPFVIATVIEILGWDSEWNGGWRVKYELPNGETGIAVLRRKGYTLT